MRIVSWRRRISTVSSATSRWPRTIRSSAHSLLPMPLSPTISTPRPSMSISTAWIIVRSASESSSIDVSFAMAVGVATGVLSSGRRARSASTTHLGGRREAAGDEDAGKIERERQPQRADALGRRRGSRGSGSRSRRRSGRGRACRYSWKPASARPVFWMCGLVMTRDEPVGAGQQLERQAERLRAAAEQGANADAGRVSHRGLIRLRSRTSVSSPSATAEQDADARGLDVAKDDDAVAAGVDLARGVCNGHGLDRLIHRAQDPRHPHGLAHAPAVGRGDRPSCRRALGPVAEPRCRPLGSHFPFTRLNLLRDLVDRLRSDVVPRSPVSPTPWRNFSPRACSVMSVAMPVLLACQDGVGRHGAVVQQTVRAWTACLRRGGAARG